jgi:outer membrane lipoprotein-sorting protein
LNQEITLVRKVLTIGMLVAAWISAAASVHAEDANAIVQAGFDYYRGKTSVGVVDMTIHRPEWERVMTIKAWTKGQDTSIFYIIAPPKDEGNGTLKKGRQMWMYNPKVNRVIKIPPSMMSQAWMGSDFSNNDLAKSDSLLQDYTHKIVGTELHHGRTVYIIESAPLRNAPVVWGMQRLKIRDDHIWLEEAFFDEDLKPVKVMTAHELTMLGDKLFPRRWTMRKVEKEDEYTMLEYRELMFDVELPDRLFTVSSLKNPPR